MCASLNAVHDDRFTILCVAAAAAVNRSPHPDVKIITSLGTNVIPVNGIMLKGRTLFRE